MVFLCPSSKTETVDLLVAPLSDICNLSFKHGVFPDKLKIAKIFPVFKSDDPKVFEEHFYFRLLKFLTKFNILNHHQYGFRSHHYGYLRACE